MKTNSYLIVTHRATNNVEHKIRLGRNMVRLKLEYLIMFPGILYDQVSDKNDIISLLAAIGYKFIIIKLQYSYYLFFLSVKIPNRSPQAIAAGTR